MWADVGAEDPRCVPQFYREGSEGEDSVMGGDEHDSNAEAYDGNDYPDDDASFGGCGSYGGGYGSDGGGHGSDGGGHDADDYRDADAYDPCWSDDEGDAGENAWTVSFRHRHVPRREPRAAGTDGPGDAHGGRGGGAGSWPSHAMSEEARDEGGGDGAAALA